MGVIVIVVPFICVRLVSLFQYPISIKILLYSQSEKWIFLIFFFFFSNDEAEKIIFQITIFCFLFYRTKARTIKKKKKFFNEIPIKYILNNNLGPEYEYQSVGGLKKEKELEMEINEFESEFENDENQV